MATINIEQIADTIVEELESFTTLAIEDISNAIKSVSKETISELRKTSPQETGAYAKSWASKRSPGQGPDTISRVIYNKAPHHGKAHLLEFGHEAADGSLVPARPHIKAAEQKASELMDAMLTKPIGG